MSIDEETESRTEEVCYRHPKRESRVRCQRCDRPICPACQLQAPVGVQCRECVDGAVAGERRARGSLARAFRPGGSTPIVTYSIMAICVALYIVQWVTSGALTRAWLMDPSAIASEPWRLITAAFLHSQGFILHLLFNLYVLYAFGPMLERFLDRSRYIALYLIGALGGSVAGVLVYQSYVVSGGASAELSAGFLTPGLAVGASGAIFALLGAVLVLRRPLGVNLYQFGVLLVINFAISFFVPSIAWEAHVGGFLTGMAIAAVYAATRRRRDRWIQVAWVAGIAVALIAICVACVLTAPYAYH